MEILYGAKTVKSGALSVHCWRLAVVDFGRDQRSSYSLRGSRNFLVR